MQAVYIDCSEFMASLLSGELRALVPNLHVHVGEPDRELLPSVLCGAAGVLNGHTRMDEVLLRALPAVRTIVFLGSGPASYIDLAAAARLGIRVRSVTHYGDRTIAEHAFALMLAAARQIAGMDQELRRGVWNPRSGIEIAGKTLGVIGTGGVGQQMIRIANAFGMQVLAWNRKPVPASLPCRAVALEELLAAADVISIHLALTPETTGLLDARRMALMRPGAILVNTARGAILDEAALIAQLRSGRLAHAALDVFATEPLAPGHPLTELDNVTLSAHAAFKTPEASARLLRRALEMLRQDLAALAASEPLAASL